MFRSTLVLFLFVSAASGFAVLPPSSIFKPSALLATPTPPKDTLSGNDSAEDSNLPGTAMTGDEEDELFFTQDTASSAPKSVKAPAVSMEDISKVAQDLAHKAQDFAKDERVQEISHKAADFAKDVMGQLFRKGWNQTQGNQGGKRNGGCHGRETGKVR